tara:strand:- start:185 stop:385 length:201 start_codon:yes stop_codon:yes gene_type:complete
MAGTADLIAQGFGTWSTVAKVPTLGLSIAEPTPPADGGLEWLVPNTQLHFVVKDDRLEWLIRGPNE